MTRTQRFAGVIGLGCCIGILGCQPPALLIQPVTASKTLEEQVIERDKGLFIFNKIAVIDVDGLLLQSTPVDLFGQGDNPVSLFREKLDKARRDIFVKAVIVRINSCGGSVGATDAMYHALQEFRKTTGKPVVAYCLDTAASGAYYLACAADGIMAQPACVTGSIGVIMQTLSVAGTMDKLGIKAVAIKSGELKDLASPLKDLSDREKQLLQEVVLQHYERFLAAVLAGRSTLSDHTLRPLADGRIFTAEQALDHGLIDKIGYPQDAVTWAKELAAVKRTQVVIYQRPYDHKPNMYASAKSPVEAGALVNIQLPLWLKSEGSQFLYLWQPNIE
jgi:protease-4